ncbi:hypothetical protein [Mesorhizobium sp. M0091]|uniref:hypothetical protein n=1 Tax=Mesorhizobium sp. M0091 TaxID=2956875 RepID=UPI003336BCD3
MTAPMLADLIGDRSIGGLDAAVLSAVWRGKGMAVATERLFDAMYADDPDGGPSPTRMYKYLRRSVTRLEGLLDGTGWAVVAAGRRHSGYRLTMHQQEIDLAHNG